MIFTPQTGVDSVMSVAFLGWPFAIFVMSAAVMGLWRLVRGSFGRRRPNQNLRTGWWWRTVSGLVGGALRSMSQNNLGVVGGWPLASAAITVWLPATGLTALAEWGSLGAGLAALTLSLHCMSARPLRCPLPRLLLLQACRRALLWCFSWPVRRAMWRPSVRSIELSAGECSQCIWGRLPSEAWRLVCSSTNWSAQSKSVSRWPWSIMAPSMTFPWGFWSSPWHGLPSNPCANVWLPELNESANGGLLYPE